MGSPATYTSRELDDVIDLIQARRVEVVERSEMHADPARSCEAADDYTQVPSLSSHP